MSAANLSGAICADTSWGDTDLRGVKNLDRIRHRRPSSIGFDTAIVSGGELPDIFLKGCGLPDAVLAYVRSLAQSRNPIQLYSCFISHSSQDEVFCHRLHNDLQAAGVRCGSLLRT